MLTLNQVRNHIKLFFEQHAQVNSVFTKTESDFQGQRNVNYSAVNIEYVNSSFSEKMMDFNFMIYVLNQSNGDAVIEDEIISDCTSIAGDFLAWSHEQPQWSLRRSGTIDPLRDYGSDRCSGVDFRVVLSVIRGTDCQIPYKI